MAFSWANKSITNIFSDAGLEWESINWEESLSISFESWTIYFNGYNGWCLCLFLLFILKLWSNLYEENPTKCQKYIRNSRASNSGGMIILFMALASYTLLCFHLVSSLWERHQGPRICSEKSMKTVKGLEYKSHGEGLRELGLFRLENRRFRGDLTALYNCLRGGRGEVSAFPR